MSAKEPEVYKVSVVSEFITWSSILIFTLGEASRVTEKCRTMLVQAIVVRNEGYMNANREDLDSFLLFLMNVSMDARVFGIPVTPSARSMLLVAATIMIHILFRADMIAVSWFA